MNSQLIIKNIKNWIELCPIKKTQLHDQDLVLVKKKIKNKKLWLF